MGDPGHMEIKPTTSKTPATLRFAIYPPFAIALGWLLLLTAPPGLDGVDQAGVGVAVGGIGLIASVPALIISIRVIRSGGAHRGLATFAAVANLACVAFTLSW
jgi:hypothetical protein